MASSKSSTTSSWSRRYFETRLSTSTMIGSKGTLLLKSTQTTPRTSLGGRGLFLLELVAGGVGGASQGRLGAAVDRSPLFDVGEGALGVDAVPAVCLVD